MKQEGKGTYEAMTQLIHLELLQRNKNNANQRFDRNPLFLRQRTVNSKLTAPYYTACTESDATDGTDAKS